MGPNIYIYIVNGIKYTTRAKKRSRKTNIYKSQIPDLVSPVQERLKYRNSVIYN